MSLFALVYACGFAATSLYGPLGANALLAAGLSGPVIGRAVSLQSVFRIVAQPVWGGLADRRAGRTGSLIAFAFAALALALAALALWPTAAVLVVASAVIGAFGSAGFTLTDSTLLQRVRGDRHAYGRARMMGTFGFAACLLLVGLAAERRLIEANALLVYGLAAVFAGGAAWFARRLDGGGAASDDGTAPAPVWTKQFIVLIGIGAAHWASHSSHNTFVVALGRAEGLDMATIAFGVTTGLALEMVVMRTAGRWLAVLGPQGALLLTAVVGLGRWAAMAFWVRSPALFVAVSTLHGISFGMFHAAMMTAVSEASPPRSAHRAQGLFMSLAFGVGGVVGSNVAGEAYDRAPNATAYAAMLPFSAAAVALALLAWVPTARRRGAVP